jgi:hypothetical protein
MYFRWAEAALWSPLRYFDNPCRGAEIDPSVMAGRCLRVAISGFVSERVRPVGYFTISGIDQATMRRMRWSGQDGQVQADLGFHLDYALRS